MTRTDAGSASRQPRVTVVVAALVASCYGDPDRGRFGPRLAPVPLDGGALVRAPADLAGLATAVTAAGGLVPVEAGHTSRLARPLEVPSETATRIPEGVRELRFFVTEPVAASSGAPSCRVELEATWDAGAAPQIVSVVPSSGASGGWLAFRLTARPRRQPTLLRLRARPSAACTGIDITFAQSEVTPIAPGWNKRPNVVLVVVTGLGHDELDCSPATSARWPRLFSRWCSRAVVFDAVFAASPEPAGALSAMLTGEWAAAATASGSACASATRHLPGLAERLQGEGYSTFGVVSGQAPAVGWRGFDTLVAVPAAAEPLAGVREVMGRVLAHLGEERFEPLFVALVLPAVSLEARGALDRELDRLIDFFVDARLESRSAFLVTATGATAVASATGGSRSALESLHVPLLLVPPARSGTPPALSRSSALVSGVDVFATGLALAGAPIPTTSGSRDLTWALAGTLSLGRELVVSLDCPSRSKAVRPGSEQWGGADALADSSSARCDVAIRTPRLYAVRAGDTVRAWAVGRERDTPLPASAPELAELTALVERLDSVIGCRASVR